MIGEWIKLVLLSSSSLFGVYIVFGFIMNFVERLNTQLIYGTVGYIGIVITGFVGTVVHEFSHFILCRLFRHQVIEVAWFRPIEGMKDGVLGYVSHSYDKGSIYQQIGNFFIGIAPILVGSLIVMLLYQLFLPKSAKAFRERMNTNLRKATAAFNLGGIIILLIQQTGALLTSLFNKENMKKPFFWIFLFVTYSITSHMSLSFADLEGAMAGLIVLLGIVAVISFVLALFQVPFRKCASVLIRYNAFVISIFSIGLSFSVVMLLITFCIHMIMS